MEKPSELTFGGDQLAQRSRKIEASTRQPPCCVNLLDENIRDDQRMLLRRWRIPFRQIGKEISRAGIHDDNLLPLLHRLKRPTLFTQDEDFFERKLCHCSYCLVWLNVKYIEVAAYIRRFLQHPQFCTQAQRLGKVVRAHPDSLHYWQVGEARRICVEWTQL